MNRQQKPGSQVKNPIIHLLLQYTVCVPKFVSNAQIVQSGKVPIFHFQAFSFLIVFICLSPSFQQQAQAKAVRVLVPSVIVKKKESVRFTFVILNMKLQKFSEYQKYSDITVLANTSTLHLYYKRSILLLYFALIQHFTLQYQQVERVFRITE